LKEQATRRPPIISIVVPVRNEASILEKKYNELCNFLRERFSEFEVIMVENGSTDKTPQILEDLSANQSELRTVNLSQPEIASAIIAGVERARSDKVIWLGIDFSNIDFIWDAFLAMDESDMALITKRLGLDRRRLLRKTMNRVFNMLVFLFFPFLDYKDVEGYHGFRRTAYASVRSAKSRGHLFNVEILLLAHRNRLKVNQVPMIVDEIRPSKYARSLVGILRVVLLSISGLVLLRWKYSAELKVRAPQWTRSKPDH